MGTPSPEADVLSRQWSSRAEKLQLGLLRMPRTAPAFPPIPSSDVRGKDKLQPMITCYLTGGMKENIESPPADSQWALKENHMSISGERAHSEGAREIFNENDSLLITMQGADGGPLGTLGNREDQKLSNDEEVNAPVSKSMQPCLVELESNGSAQVSQGKADIPPVVCEGDSSYTVQSLEAGAKKTGTRKKAPDWSKDGGDKLYSLTEDSDTTSSGCNQSETGGSTSSESGSVSSIAESTVRQQGRQHKGLKTWVGLSGGTELSAQSSKTLKWDYSGTNLTGIATRVLTCG
ncbi:hypothetical protein NDU88_003245 [Pleurodeles waltl]|uniref:Uncharacterized protein n=1 Tax=Pleurodeles waltl TaxID=8319 RepID=A0AAV7VFI8_PLEWA|nr:hypothetical protein NDU88_003245 [Pleurodeles waltl]